MSFRPVAKYVKNVLIGLDQLANALLGGDPDETVSSRCGKSRCRLCRVLCRMLDRLDYRHCAESVELDEGKDAT